MRGMGKEVILVSSGAIATGRQTLGGKKPETVAEKQAYAAVGQARLMMVYQKLFSELQPDGGTDPDHKGDDPGRYFPRKREKYVQ